MKAVKLSAEKLQLANCLSVDSEKLTLWCWVWRMSLSLFQRFVLSLVPKNPDLNMFTQTISDVLASALNVLSPLSQLKASSNLYSIKVCLRFEFDAILIHQWSQIQLQKYLLTRSVSGPQLQSFIKLWSSSCDCNFYLSTLLYYKGAERRTGG